MSINTQTMTEHQMVVLILSIAGSVILILMTILGWFLARVITDVRKNTEEIGKNKGRIELVEQQQINDTKRIEAMTQLELRNMSHSVNELSKNVNVLVTALAKKGIDAE
jgi:hypothetical protein